ncbi:MAG TPA: hypothetical protein VI854_05900 [Acidimicrobiia bacterium]|nr:hypothetical protein [Acidimicrobiia bacterium]
MEKVSASELRIVSVTPNDGWSREVTAESGPRVKVRFKQVGVPEPATTRFAATLNDDGSEIHIKVTTCP